MTGQMQNQIFCLVCTSRVPDTQQYSGAMLVAGLYLLASLAILCPGRPQSPPRPSCLSSHQSGEAGATAPSSSAPIAGMVTSPAPTTATATAVTTTTTATTTTTTTATATISAKPTSFYRRVLKPPCTAFRCGVQHPRRYDVSSSIKQCRRACSWTKRDFVVSYQFRP